MGEGVTLRILARLEQGKGVNERSEVMTERLTRTNRVVND